MDLAKHKKNKLLLVVSLALVACAGLFLLNPGEAVANTSPPISGSDCVEISVGIDGEDCIGDSSRGLEGNPIMVYLKGIINFLAVGVTIVAIISIVIGGFQFMSARDNPQQIQAAQHRIWNAVIALLLFIFMYAILNFLVPGGLIG